MLDLKQKAANAWEAREARETAVAASKQGNVSFPITLIESTLLELTSIGRTSLHSRYYLLSAIVVHVGILHDRHIVVPQRPAQRRDQLADRNGDNHNV